MIIDIWFIQGGIINTLGKKWTIHMEEGGGGGYDGSEPISCPCIFYNSFLCLLYFWTQSATNYSRR